MQPTFFQQLFTDNRPLHFLMAAGAIVMLALTAAVLIPPATTSPWDIGRLLILPPVAACLGAVLAVFPGGMFMAIFLRWIERRNGAPFHEGNEVMILSRRSPGRVARIYDVWEERRQVRVDLDDAARREFADVFSYTDVCRLRPDKPAEFR